MGKARHGSIKVSHLGGRRCCPRTEKRQGVFRKNKHQSQEKAFYHCLVPKLRDNEILFLDKMDLSKPKTKEAVEIVSSLSK